MMRKMLVTIQMIVTYDPNDEKQYDFYSQIGKTGAGLEMNRRISPDNDAPVQLAIDKIGRVLRNAEKVEVTFKSMDSEPIKWDF